MIRVSAGRQHTSLNDHQEFVARLQAEAFPGFARNHDLVLRGKGPLGHRFTILEQAGLRVVRGLPIGGFLLRWRCETSHQREHPLVVVVDLEQRRASLAVAFDGA